MMGRANLDLERAWGANGRRKPVLECHRVLMVY